MTYVTFEVRGESSSLGVVFCTVTSLHDIKDSFSLHFNIIKGKVLPITFHERTGGW
jgi:hypothetical protein